MRIVRKIEYVVRKESDIDKKLIYAFGKKNDISVLALKDSKYYWNPLAATNQVWYKNYDTIEEAIDGILEVSEYKDKGFSDIIEFEDLQEFLEWSLNIINQ